MAMMRESVTSLKWYFIIIALISAYRNVFDLSQSQGNIIVVIFSFIGIGFSITWFYLGIQLKRLLAKSPKVIITILFSTIGYLGLVSLLELLGGSPAGLIKFFVGILITWYLLRNVKRLSLEQQLKNK